MQIVFILIAALTLVGAIAAMSLRNPVHCALCVAVAFGGLAAFYLHLGASFVGWAQVLVYVGAVAILIVFAILLTRSGEPAPWSGLSKSAVASVAVALIVFGVLTKAILGSSVSGRDLPTRAEPTVREIGNQLMTRYVLPFEAIGLLLTAATIGAVIIAMPDKKPADAKKTETSEGHGKPPKAANH